MTYGSSPFSAPHMPFLCHTCTEQSRYNDCIVVTTREVTPPLHHGNYTRYKCMLEMRATGGI